MIRRLTEDLPAAVYRWTGHFPERTRALLQRLVARADELQQFYRQDQEARAATAVTTLVTALAMNHVCRGSYVPAETRAE